MNESNYKQRILSKEKKKRKKKVCPRVGLDYKPSVYKINFLPLSCLGCSSTLDLDKFKDLKPD